MSLLDLHPGMSVPWPPSLDGYTRMMFRDVFDMCGHTKFMQLAPQTDFFVLNFVLLELTGKYRCRPVALSHLRPPAVRAG